MVIDSSPTHRIPQSLAGYPDRSGGCGSIYTDPVSDTYIYECSLTSNSICDYRQMALDMREVETAPFTLHVIRQPLSATARRSTQRGAPQMAQPDRHPPIGREQRKPRPPPLHIEDDWANSLYVQALIMVGGHQIAVSVPPITVPESDSYPGPNDHWKNEDGIQIDTDHWPVPKAALRGILKEQIFARRRDTWWIRARFRPRQVIDHAYEWVWHTRHIAGWEAQQDAHEQGDWQITHWTGQYDAQ
ncbi:hypothetical protein EDD16DRAFT_1526967 [Pisolithus croceorrhizus]|nr:hypothetical protein EDD16DRAFT_1526967 [Pisolithus croceorrhizus]KAI6107866.1 hypothetical protein EV401DRAFT_2117124 [Pisolithus croceorrhizus]KAI6139605.1 hypothetical protein EDD17DRAFT_1902854 [Pisolithus thermaeus]